MIIVSLFLLTIFLVCTQGSNLDTINASRILTDNGETIVSSNGTFELGFFSPDNSRNRYVGIWYKKISVQTVVWVANRDSPIPEASSGTLRVVDPGLLVLVNHTNGTVWSTNTSRTGKNPIARLLDSGNLVVKDANDDSYLWESFDYPTDTLLPGMKLGWNFRTGLEVYLRSWRASNDPSSGDYTYHCDPKGYPHKVLKRGGEIMYRSGPLSGPGSSLRENSIFRYGLVMNKNEVYYHYELLNSSVITKFMLTEAGVGQRSVWVDRTRGWVVYLTAPTDNCDTYKTCGSYGICRVENSPVCGCLNKFTPKDSRGWERGDWSNGCARRMPLSCKNGDGFLKYSGVKLPDTWNSRFNQSMNLEECKKLCSSNCTCTAYASLDADPGGSGCLLWFGQLVDIREMSPGAVIYLRMASSELGSKGRTRKILIVTLALVIGIVLLSLSLMLYYWRRRKVDNQQIQKGHNKNLELPLFDISTLTKATGNFSINNKLGEGGYGPVYKGFLEEGQEIAVKRLSKTSHQGVDEFKNEVICTAKLQHRNLVKLLGCCIQGEESMLVYEYLTNKSLDLILFDPVKSMLLDLPTRLNIINGIARGLLYLHQDSRLRIIHRDLKASNVLLDSDMNPKISDFGIARAFGENETGAKTKRVIGTYGYMSPEYAVDGVFSVKSDVFSFGVLVLEIVSGKRNREFSHRDHSLNLLGHAWLLYKEERQLELIDSDLKSSCNIPEVIRVIHIGLLCVQQFPNDRPTMSSVVLMLSNESELSQPKHPGFFTGRQTSTTDDSDVPNATSSTNEMTITMNMELKMRSLAHIMNKIVVPRRGLISSTSIHITAIDGTLNVNSLFTVAVFLGIFINPADPKNRLVGTAACSASATVEKQFVEFHVYSFSSFLFSSLIASGLKLAIRNDDKRGETHGLSGREMHSAGQVNLRVLRAGILATAVGSLFGCAFLALALVDLMQIKLGSMACWGWYTLAAISPLLVLVPSALLSYIGLLFYAFTK